MSDTLARLLDVLWGIIRFIAVLGIAALVLAVVSIFFVAAIEGWEEVGRKIKQLAERKRK